MSIKEIQPITVLRDQVATLKSLLSDTRKERDFQKTMLETADNHLKGLRKERDALTAERDRLKLHVADQLMILRRTEIERETLREENDRLVADKAALMSEGANWEHAHEILIQERDRLKGELEERGGQLEGALETINAFEFEHEQKVRSLTGKLSASRRREAELAAACLPMRNFIQSYLKNYLAANTENEIEMARACLAITPSEALAPVRTILLALRDGTTWELCDSIKQQLNAALAAIGETI